MIDCRVETKARQMRNCVHTRLTQSQHKLDYEMYENGLFFGILIMSRVCSGIFFIAALFQLFKRKVHTKLSQKHMHSQLKIYICGDKLEILCLTGQRKPRKIEFMLTRCGTVFRIKKALNANIP